MNLSEEIATRVEALWHASLPQEAMGYSRTALLDWLGVLLAGSIHKDVERVRELIVPLSSRGNASVYGTTHKLNELDATFLNAIAGHILEYDDSNSRLHGHLSAVSLPVILAIAESRKMSGMEVVRAYNIASEVGSRIGRGVSRHQYTIGWHPTTTVGIFGAVCAAAMMLGLNSRRTAFALGIAISFASGVKANFGTMTKSLAVGHCGRSALLAVQLAAAGLESNLRAFEHNQGYLRLFNGETSYEINRILESWGDPLSVVEVGLQLKRYPCCYACLPVIDCVESIMRRQQVSIEEIVRIDVSVHRIRFPHINISAPTSDFEAKFSAHYCVARCLLRGSLCLEDFESNAFLESDAQALMSCVHLSFHDGKHTGSASVQIVKADGSQLESATLQARGATRASPLSMDDVQSKFNSLAKRLLDSETVIKLSSLILSIDTVVDVAEISHLAARRANFQPSN